MNAYPNTVSHGIEVARTDTVVTPARALPSIARPVLRRQLVAEGNADREIKRSIAARDLDPLARGIYLPHRTSGDETWPEDRYRSLVAGVAERSGSDGVISHISAAAMWGLPFWDVEFDKVHVTRPVRKGTHRSPLLHVHSTTADPDVETVNGMRVTTPARTVVDCARMLAFEQAVAIVDAALNSGLVTPENLLVELEHAARWRGVQRARAAVQFGDARSESVGESRSRVLMHRAGLMPPELQYEVLDGSGRLLARCDFAYPEFKVLGEFDGKVKYGRLLKPGQSAGDAVFEEKQREDALRRLGWIVVRWIWSDLYSPEGLVIRLRDALARASAQR